VLGGTGHEAQFCPLAPELGVLDIDSLICHFCLNFEKSTAADRSVRVTRGTNKKAALVGRWSLAIYYKFIISQRNG
jgi:hypothetical protein